MKISIDFYVSGNVRQTIDIAHSYTREEFERKLKAGRLAFTLYNDQLGRATVIDLDNLNIAGIVECQVPLDDVEYKDIEVVPE